LSRRTYSRRQPTARSAKRDARLKTTYEPKKKTPPPTKTRLLRSRTESEGGERTRDADALTGGGDNGEQPRLTTRGAARVGGAALRRRRAAGAAWRGEARAEWERKGEGRGEWGELIMEARRSGRMRGDTGCLSFEWGTVLAPVRGKKPQFLRSISGTGSGNGRTETGLSYIFLPI
jgi:hypothetical protein